MRALIGLLGLLLFAQAGAPGPRRSLGRADGGSRPILLGPDPQGRLRHSDGGSSASSDAADAGPSSLAVEVQALRARVQALEGDRAQAQRQSEQLDQLAQELRALRAELRQGEAGRQQQAQAQQVRGQQVQQSVNGLAAAQQALASGNENIGDALDAAEATLTGPARGSIAAARDALRNRDLSAARAFLAQAVAQAQSER